MTYDSAEASVQDSEPRELFTLAINSGTAGLWRHNSAGHAITLDGFRYEPLALERGEVAVSMPGDEQDLTVTLPIDHPFVRRWLQQGIPPMAASVTVFRQNGGETIILWIGNVASLSANGGVAKLRVPSRAGDWMMRVVPSLPASRACPHMLGDANCGVDLTGTGPTGLPHRVVATVLHVEGRDVRVDLSTIPAADALRNGWSMEGQFLHVASGDRQTVSLQTDLAPGTGTIADLQLQFPVVGLQVGHTVHVFAGCRGDIATCRVKFDNKAQFGGAPQMPLKNPFTPQGWGILDNV